MDATTSRITRIIRESTPVNASEIFDEKRIHDGGFRVSMAGPERIFRESSSLIFSSESKILFTMINFNFLVPSPVFAEIAVSRQIPEYLRDLREVPLSERHLLLFKTTRILIGLMCN